MENKEYLIYEVGNIEGNDKDKIKFISFVLYTHLKYAIIN